MAVNENDIVGAVVSGNIGQLLGAGSFGAVFGAIAIIVAALIKRQPAMVAAVNDSVRTLFEAQERRIVELEEKVVELTKALEEERKQRGFGA
ncbi:hypothetical protein MPC4_80127 [Methylocella tundrae]|uniref:Uncharacterized protein n=1 Tax=Methylocella tundrae TaxID=227605 RepID=A0A8B6MDD4_METTU|nr:hypothetical protein [Methylocella tundrae]VTZ24340.1 hypothetical protein MPC1_170002 [Methylocella tundrae]VTZ52456.1 hypothetical protein MPC4_80127 [Methylocella tundrae]